MFKENYRIKRTERKSFAAFAPSLLSVAVALVPLILAQTSPGQQDTTIRVPPGDRVRVTLDGKRAEAVMEDAGPYDLKTEWRSSLALNVMLLLSALENEEAGNRVTAQMWGPVKNNTLSARDRLRFTIGSTVTGDPKHPVSVEIKYPRQTWRRVTGGTVGVPIELAVPIQNGNFDVRILVQPRNKPEVIAGSHSFAVESSDCHDFYNRVLILIAEAIYQYGQTAGIETYQEAWAAGRKPADPLLMKVESSTRAPYTIKTGDVVLRSGGRTSSVMGSLGSPDSPQTHAAIAVVRSVNGQRLVTVRQVSLGGYEEIPLSIADGKILEQIDSLATRPVSFIEGSNVGSVEIYRPMGTILGPSGDYRYDAIGDEAAIRARRIGETVTGYDYAFMEQGSSTLAGSATFKNLYYCTEFVRDAFGVSLAAADEKKVLKDFWQAAFRCDAESGTARTRRANPSSMISALEDVPWDDITFDATDPKANAKARRSIREVIAVLKDLSRGTTIRQLLTQNVRDGVAEELRKNLPGGAPVAYNLALMMVQPETRAWLILSAGAVTQGIASNLVDEMIDDLANAVGTRQLLAGGSIKNANGDDVYVRFLRIN